MDDGKRFEGWRARGFCVSGFSVLLDWMDAASGLSISFYFWLRGESLLRNCDGLRESRNDGLMSLVLYRLKDKYMPIGRYTEPKSVIDEFEPMVQ